MPEIFFSGRTGTDLHACKFSDVDLVGEGTLFYGDDAPTYPPAHRADARCVGTDARSRRTVRRLPTQRCRRTASAQAALRASARAIETESRTALSAEFAEAAPLLAAVAAHYH